MTLLLGRYSLRAVAFSKLGHKSNLFAQLPAMSQLSSQIHSHASANQPNSWHGAGAAEFDLRSI